MPKFFLTCTKYCETNREKIEKWSFFKKEEEDPLGLGFEEEENIIEQQYDLPDSGEKLDPMAINQFINGIGRIINYRMDSSEGKGKVEHIVDMYEGQIENGQPKGLGRRLFYNSDGVAGAFLGCFKNERKTLDAKPGVYFEDHKLKYYGLWDTVSYSRAEPDEDMDITEIDCDKDY